MDPLATALVARAATAFGTRVVSGARKLKQREQLKDVAVARDLDSYAVTDDFDLSAATAALALTDAELGVVGDFLQGLEAEALVHELLAARLLGAPERRVARIDRLFTLRLCAQLSGRPHDEVTALAQSLFTALDARCQAVATGAAATGSETLDRLRQNAAYALINATLEAIERHASAFESDAEAEDAYREHEILYRAQMKDQHGFITPPDLDRRDSVPLEDLYVSPQILPEGREALDLDGLWSQVDRTVLLGEPGGGKSTATSALLHKLASSSIEPVPFLVVLRDYALYKDQMSVVEYLELRLRSHYQCKPPAGYVERQLLSGRAAVFFDGLDELLDTTARRDITDRVQMFSIRFPLTRIFVTSRVVGYDQAPMDSGVFTKFVLSNFSDERVADYVNKWFRVDRRVSEEAAAELAAVFIRESRSVHDLRRNPLMLALMCIIYKGQNFIPRNRPDVYERCATLLFEKWDGHRHIRPGIAAEDYVDEALKHIAYWMLTADKSGDGVTRSQLIVETADYLKRAFEDPVKARRAAAEFVDFCKGRAWVFSDAGTTAEGEDLFKFTHRTFMEYFAAYELTRTEVTPDRLAKKLLPHVAKQEWDTVGQLAVAISGRRVKFGSEQVMRAMLDEKRRRTPANRDAVLSFLARCSSFAAPFPRTLRDLSQEIFLQCISANNTGLHQQSGLRELLHSTQPEQYEYVDDEFRTAFINAITSSNTAVIGRAFTTLLVLGNVRPPGDQGDDASLRHYLNLRDELLTEHSSELQECFERQPAMRAVGFRHGVVSAPDYMKALRRLARATGRRVLDPLYEDVEVPQLRLMYGPMVMTLVRALRPRVRLGHRSHELLGLVADELENAQPPLVTTLRQARFLLTNGLREGPNAVVLTPAVERTREYDAALTLWCSLQEQRPQRPDAYYRQAMRRFERQQVAPGEVPLGLLLVLARSGSETAQAELAVLTLPLLVEQWSRNEVHLVADSR